MSAANAGRVVCAGLLATVAAGWPNAQSWGRLDVCHAGSLLAAFTRVEKEFSTRHPDVEVSDHSGGSVDLGRRLATGDVVCDVYAPADYLDVDLLLKPAGLADYSIVFASGRMVLAYLASDPKAEHLPVSGDFYPPDRIPTVAPEWYRTLLAPGVRIGGAHPFLDPGGYRSHMMFELAQSHYKVPGLYNSLLSHYAVIPADPSDPSSALGREINFQLTYEHNAAATAKNNPAYRYAHLPDAIDLSSSAQAAAYAKVSVTVPGLGLPGTPAAVSIPGSRAAWGVTVIKTSPNQESARAFVQLLLEPIGTAALTASGPVPLVPARVSPSDYARLPKSLQPLVASSTTVP